MQTLDSLTDEKDPLDTSQDSPDDEPSSKRPKLHTDLNLEVYQIPAYNIPKSLSIFPAPANTLPSFVNNPLNLANPLALAASNGVKSNVNVKRYSLPSKLSITPTSKSAVNTLRTSFFETGVKYKKNGEVAKKRGPPKGYKRKPKGDGQSQSSINMPPITASILTQAQNMILTSLLATTSNIAVSVTNTPQSKVKLPKLPNIPATITVVPQLQVPKGTELIELLLNPCDWFPDEPYRMVFHKKKNQKWKEFPYQCEHCFKGYRVASTLLTHTAERHGCVPKTLSFPCPCCPHVSLRRKHHKKHLETHEGRRHRIFCVYCIPPVDPTEPYEKESVKYPFDKFPQFWYASEESLRLHKKRKHPYAALFNQNWFSSWGMPS